MGLIFNNHAIEVHRTLRLLKRQGQHVREIQEVDSRPEKFNLLCDKIDGMTTRYGFNSKERPFLHWLWEHREEILKFILEIIAIIPK